jgi:hypothetical protein
MILEVIFMQNKLAFETLKRSTNADWFGLLMFFLGLIFLLVLFYRNPQILNSLISRIFKNDSEKLFFSAPAIDTIDRIFLFLIYLSTTLLTVHFFVEQELNLFWRFLIYSLPLLAILYFILPFYFISLVVGFSKHARHILAKQSNLLFFFGLALLPIVGFLFFDSYSLIYVKWVIALILASTLLWIHLRVFRELIINGYGVYYIFMYFCTLEILPVSIIWVLITRD